MAKEPRAGQGNGQGTREWAWAWTAAFGITLTVLAGLWALHKSQLAALLDGRETVFIGTSLARYAIEPTFGDETTDPLGPAPFLRLAYPGATEHQIYGLAKAAAATAPQRIFLEINPIVSSFAHRNYGCSWQEELRVEFMKIRHMGRSLIKRKSVFRDFLKGPTYNTAKPLDAAVTLKRFPLALDGSCFQDRWRKLRRNHPDTAFYMVAMPRSPAARDIIGAHDMALFALRAQRFAQSLDIPLLIVDSENAWPQSVFVDHAHLTSEGAARFLDRLADWLETNP